MKPVYRQIADAMRDEILLGKTQPGTQLPSTGELATAWNSSPSTIHNALVTLVKEGWIRRLNGAGTYVSDPENRFVCAGIYYQSDIFSDETMQFARTWNASLVEHFRRIGKTTRVFIDTRPPEDQTLVLPALVNAITERSIQCVVAASVHDASWPAFANLKVPMAFLDNPPNVNCALFDLNDLIRKAARQMAENGCRSIGLISSVNPKSPSVGKTRFYENFRLLVQEAGLTVRPEWILSPEGYVGNAESYGYEQFMRLWKMSERPDSLLVFPDQVVRGVITGILEVGIAIAPSRMRFVFHRNAKTQLLCPFPATWAISDEDICAESVVRLIQKQFDGEEVYPVSLPYGIETRDRVP